MCYMIEGGGSKIYHFVKGWIYKWPEESKKLLQKMAEICVDFLVEQVTAGAQVFPLHPQLSTHTIADTMADMLPWFVRREGKAIQLIQVFDSCAGELSPHDFNLFSLPYLQHISKKLRERLQDNIVPMIVFAKGAWYALDALCQSGYDVVGLDWTHDPAEAVRTANGRVTLQGNMDPNVLYGGKDAITDNVERMLGGFKGARGRYIINLGHGEFFCTVERGWVGEWV